MYTYDYVSTEKIRRQYTPFVYYYDEVQWVQYIWKELITVEWLFWSRCWQLSSHRYQLRWW